MTIRVKHGPALPNLDQASAGQVVIKGNIVRVRRGHGHGFVGEAVQKKKSTRRPAKVAQMLAMAHHLQSKIDQGEIKDRAELARRLGITRARVTQILDMTLLAPAIQKEVLFMEAVDRREPMSERDLHQFARRPAWADQRAAWRTLHLDRR